MRILAGVPEQNDVVIVSHYASEDAPECIQALLLLLLAVKPLRPQDQPRDDTAA